MWWNSTRGKKVGFVVKVISLVTWMPLAIGLWVQWLFGLKRVESSDDFIIYMLGWLVTAIMFLIIWLLRALWIWLNDDTGKIDPWQWGFWMNNED